MKYYIYRFHKRFEFKRTKTLDYWTTKYSDCWQYSKQGAKKIVDGYNARSKGFYQYGMIEVEKVEEILGKYNEK